MNRFLKCWMVLLALLFSCSENVKVDLQKGEWPYFSKDGDFQFLKLDSETSLQSKCLRYFVNENNEEFLFLLNDLNNSIYKYRFEDGEIEETYHFEKDGPQGVGKLDGFDILGQDTLVLLSKYEYKLSIVKISEKSETTVLQSFSLLKKSGDIEFTAYATTSNRIVRVGNTLVLSATPFIDPVKSELHSAGKNVIIFDLKDFTIEYRNLYTDRYKQRWPTHYQRISANYNENTKRFVYSLPAESRLIETNHNEYFKYHSVKSNYFDEPKQINGLSKTEEASKEYVTENPSFGSILYDKYRNVYYRFTERPFGEVVVKRGYKYRGRFNGVIILDESFKVIDEVEKLTPSPIDMAFVGKKGLYIKQRMSGEEDILRFRIINFK